MHHMNQGPILKVIVVSILLTIQRLSRRLGHRDLIVSIGIIQAQFTHSVTLAASNRTRPFGIEYYDAVHTRKRVARDKMNRHCI